jgi:ribosomal protein L11
MGIIKLYVPAVEARPGPPLAPILGQHQINIVEFCKEFNKISAVWSPSVPLPVKVKKLEANRFSITVNSPTIHFFLSQLMDESRSVTIEKLYDILLFKLEYLKSDKKKVANLLFGFLNSKRIKIRL